MWNALFINLAQISVIILMFQFVADRLGDMRSKEGRLVLGFVFGLVACGSIIFAPPLMDGFRIDLRGPMVACAALFGGWVAAGPAVVLTAIVRIYLGGEGMEAGLLGIVGTAGAGLACRHWLSERTMTPLSIAITAASVTAGTLLGYTLVPAELILSVLKESFVPLASFNFLTSILLIHLINRENGRIDLVQANNIFRQMVDALPDCMNAKDLHSRFIAANPATSALMGVNSPSELLGKTDADFFPPGKSEKFWSLEREVIATGKAQTVDQEIDFGNGIKRLMSTQKIPLIAEDGAMAGLITHNRDVTADRAMMKMKTEFVAVVSHELRTPLTSVRGSLAMIKGTCKDALPPTAEKLLDIAHRNSERLVHLINDLLDAERIENGGLDFQTEPRQLTEIIEGSLASIAMYAPEKNVKIEFINQAPEAIAAVEPSRFEQILANLLSNAIKFSYTGGVVTVTMSRNKEHILVGVSDRGPGIAAGFKHRIFTAFEQADTSDRRANSGTGLGLHIAKMMAGKMAGDIRFVTEEGKGTTFYLELPDQTELHAVNLMRSGSDTRSEDARLVAKRRVLYVEDDESLGSMVAELVGEGIEVVQTVTYAQSEAEIRASSYDLYLIDEMLPDGSGLDLLKIIPSAAPVIFFSAKEVSQELPPNVQCRFVKTLVCETAVASHIRRLLAAQNPQFKEAV